MAEVTGANTKTIAEILDVEPRVVRVTLRKLAAEGDIEKPEDGWKWPSEKDPDYKSTLKAVKSEIERPKSRGRRAEEEESEAKPEALASAVRRPAEKGKKVA